MVSFDISAPTACEHRRLPNVLPVEDVASIISICVLSEASVQPLMSQQGYRPLALGRPSREGRPSGCMLYVHAELCYIWTELEVELK